MKRYLRATALVALALGSLVLTGCAAQAGAEGGDGMKLPEVWGYVAAERAAQLEVDDQLGVDTLVVARVVAPADAWIVVHLDDNGVPGDRVGLKRVTTGESLDVKVPLAGVTSEKVIVAIHADKGTPGEFDFDMMKRMQSPDRPFFVNNKELAKAVTVRSSGAKASPNPGATGSSAAPAAAPTMELIAPAAGGVVPAGDVSVSVKTTGLKFVMAGNTNVAGEGHVHFTLDDKPFKMSVKPDYVYEGVTPGPHTLEAELVQNDTTPLDPPVKQEITFTAE